MEKQPYSKLAIVSFILGFWPWITLALLTLFQISRAKYPGMVFPESDLPLYSSVARIFGYSMSVSPIAVCASVILAIISRRKNSHRQVEGKGQLRGVTLAWVGAVAGITAALLGLAYWALWNGFLGSVGSF